VVLMATGGSEVGLGVVNTRGVLRADTLSSRNGEIVLDSGSSAAGVTVNGGLLSAAGNGGGLQGGTIDVTGRTILLQPFVPPPSSVVVPQPNDSGIIAISNETIHTRHGLVFSSTRHLAWIGTAFAQRAVRHGRARLTTHDSRARARPRCACTCTCTK